MGPKFNEKWDPKNEDPSNGMRNAYFWEPVLAYEREARFKIVTLALLLLFGLALVGICCGRSRGCYAPALTRFAKEGY